MPNTFIPRKALRLPYFDYSSAGAYFVTIRLKRDISPLSHILLSPYSPPEAQPDAPAQTIPQACLTENGLIIEKHLLNSNRIPRVTVDQYVIMPDHIHAILFFSKDTSSLPPPSQTPANQLLARTIAAFKRFCNKEMGIDIFQRSYMEHVIRSEADYLTRCQYILNNPTRWYERHSPSPHPPR
ncbi:MAG: hypothetical protein IKU11_11680 [Clostridia bacterium]|nr:hypothetical protein [Clostridia bacterium]